MKQFEQEKIRRVLDQRTTHRMTEFPVGVGNQAFQLSRFEGVADERLHHGRSHFLIAASSERPDQFIVERWPCFGHVQPSIRSKSGQCRLFELQWRRLATRRDVAHQTSLARVRSPAGLAIFHNQ